MSRKNAKRVRPSQKSQGDLRRYVSAREFLSIASSPVLNWESEDDFSRVRMALEYEVGPREFIEEMYVSEAVTIVWELLRWRRLKQMKIHRAYWNKLHDMLSEQCNETVESTEHDNAKLKRFNEEKFDRVWGLAQHLFDDEKARNKIADLLDGYEIDSVEIELSVMDSLWQELATLDHAIAAAELRRNRALRCIADYRESLASVIKRCTDAMIEGEIVTPPTIEQTTDRESED